MRSPGNGGGVSIRLENDWLSGMGWREKTSLVKIAAAFV
jgi:hypothetical protein